jgi:5-methylcytosine-specific restriction protein A
MPMSPRRHKPVGTAIKQHKPKAKEQHEKNRFYGRVWKAERLAYLSAHPLCEDCLANGKTVPAMDVHHDGDNRRALCRACHNRITHGRGGPGTSLRG